MARIDQTGRGLLLSSFLLFGLATRANSLSKRVRGYADRSSVGTLLVCHSMAQKSMPNESTGQLATTKDRVSTTECIGVVSDTFAALVLTSYALVSMPDGKNHDTMLLNKYIDVPATYVH
jgi:hypothetical protein